MTEAEKIAKGLSEAQRRALLRCEVFPTTSEWVRQSLGLDGDFLCYVGDGAVSSSDFEGMRHLFEVVGAHDARGAATLFGNIYPPGLAVREYLEQRR